MFDVVVSSFRSSDKSRSTFVSVPADVGANRRILF